MGIQEYRWLVLYYLEDLSSYPYYDEIMESPNQWETVCGFIDEWVAADEKVQAIIKEKFARELNGQDAARMGAGDILNPTF